MISLALPKGRLLLPTARWLERQGWDLKGYDPASRNYRPVSERFPDVRIKVFQEKDIPVQVAMGNYDLGLCGLDWVEELLARYPESPVIKLWDLGFGAGHIYLACHADFPLSLEELRANSAHIRLASEYPNLMESWGLKFRLRRFRLFPLWGAAEVYPPEDADLIILAAPSRSWLEARGLKPLAQLLPTSACLIANKNSWLHKDMGEVLSRLRPDVTFSEGAAEEEPPGQVMEEPPPEAVELRLALPDGHQMAPTLEFLHKAGLDISEYEAGRRRPRLGIKGVATKVIRPQDMPLQVACGNFDLAITGEDWLRDHLSRFPSSPVMEVMQLGFGRVRVVAAISREIPAEDIEDVRRLIGIGLPGPIRVASEYLNLADKFSREHHLSPYRLIPTWGASEVFPPEDADLLIENTQTGRTLAAHGLKVVATLFESTACIIASRENFTAKKDKIEAVLDILRRGLD